MKFKIIALLLSIIYVGLGTFWIFTSHGGDAVYIDWPSIIIATLPVTVISFAIRFGAEQYVIPVIVTQVIMFVLTYKLMIKLLSKRESYEKAEEKTADNKNIK